MKPHGLRKALWIANFALVGAVVAIGTWYFGEVRPATARATRRPLGKPPAELERLREQHERARLAGLRWKPTAPADGGEFHKYVARADYAKMIPPHWVFSGPLPSGRYQSDTPAPDAPDGPVGLESLGKVIATYYAPGGGTLVLFDFHETERNVVFGIGEFIRPNAQAPKRFQLAKVVHLTGPRYDLHYRVYGEDRTTPLREGILPIGPRGPKARSSFLEEVEDDAPTDAKPRRREERLVFAPTVTRHPTKPNAYEVLLDEPTYDVLRGKAASRIAASIKTETAIDRETGRAFGLRIAGIEADSPATAFQVKKGDVLISLNDAPVLSRSDALNILEALGDDPIVKVVLERHGKLLTYFVDSSDPRERRRASALRLPK